MSAYPDSPGVEAQEKPGSSDNEKNVAHDQWGAAGESDYATGIFEEVGDVKQGLHQRHIQMIALAGTIGTGLFLGSGRAIANAGPLGAFLGYTLVGFAAAAVVLAVGEMGTLVPLSGGIVRYAEIFVDPALSFADGWNLVYSYIVSIPAEASLMSLPCLLGNAT